MKAAFRFLRIHGETLLYAAAIVFALAVLGPSLDRYDAEHAKTAQR
ncbi:hypothetical protein [Bordetella bronchialis]|nr:hypothetical protein [Bordetella bronchialis]